MAALGSIGFLAPWLLLGLLTLPILWWLLRAVPPAAIRRRFPAVTLLLGLKDPETIPDKTPWWLLFLRMLLIAALIIGFAGPILNPKTVDSASGPLVVLADASWASAPSWGGREARINELVDEAGRAGRTIAVFPLTGPIPNDAIQLQSAQSWSGVIEPNPWEPDFEGFAAWIEEQDGSFDTYWLSDGVDRENRAALADALQSKGSLTVYEDGATIAALRPPTFFDGAITVTAMRSAPMASGRMIINALGPDPTGVERVLARAEVEFADGALEGNAVFELPVELRNRIRKFAITGVRSAGAVTVTDDALKRRKVALFAGRQAREGQELVAPLHYLRKALLPTAELIEATVSDALLSAPDAIIFADVASINAQEQADLLAWVEAGGLMVRFAGPRLAASTMKRSDEDPLLPVRLRAGGRSVGGAMSWGSPKTLRPFTKGSPFYGLEVPDEVNVSSQVLAQPDPTLSDRVIAALEDGTPLVTQKTIGAGRIVLFHVTANAEWSSLPLSGLYVQMLERLAISARTASPAAKDVAGLIWSPERVMNGFGDMRDATDMIGVEGERLLEPVGADLPPGLYGNNGRRVATNVIGPDTVLAAAAWSANITVEGFEKPLEQPLKALFLGVALALLALDILATLWLSGRLGGPRSGVIASALVVGFGLILLAPQLQAQTADDLAIYATTQTVLAYVKTGDERTDYASEAGMNGLSLVLTQRTSIEPAAPVALDLETDELAFYPLIYWPVTETQKTLSDAAYGKLNTYLRTGGMILFDTRDANLAGLGSSTPNGRKLQQLAANLDIPALEPVPEDHVLTRSFYLIQDFPGRYGGRDVWVEASVVDAEREEGMPFRNLNDGVTPVVIGGNDWASAWAVNEQGRYLFPVGRGFAGERQREIAMRFGVNLVMYVLTGNYKSDQVHVPALLERLGQ